MFRKLLIYIFIISFLQFNIGLVNVYATDSTKVPTPKTTTQTSESKITEEETKQVNKKETQKQETKEKAQEKTKEKAKQTQKKISVNQYYSGQKTLMYKEENLIKIIQILTSLSTGIKYGRSGEGIGEMANGTKELEEILDSTIISVYLNSILYISDNLWAVWVNGQKITNNNNEEDREIKVLSINPERVKFLWSINKIKWDIINANQTIKENVYTIKDEKVNMTFTLEPNQSFVPSLDKVIEGSIKQEKKEEEKPSGTKEKPSTTKEQKTIEAPTTQERDLFEFEATE